MYLIKHKTGWYLVVTFLLQLSHWSEEASNIHGGQQLQDHANTRQIVNETSDSPLTDWLYRNIFNATPHASEWKWRVSEQTEEHQSASRSLGTFGKSVSNMIYSTADRMTKYLYHTFQRIQQVANRSIVKIIYSKKGFMQIIGNAKYSLLKIVTSSSATISKLEAKMIYAVFNAVTSSLRMAVTDLGFSCVDVPQFEQSFNSLGKRTNAEVLHGSICGLANIRSLKNVTVKHNSLFSSVITIPYIIENVTFNVNVVMTASGLPTLRKAYDVSLKVISMSMTVRLAATHPKFRMDFDLLEVSGIGFNPNFKESEWTYLSLTANGIIVAMRRQLASMFTALVRRVSSEFNKNLSFMG